MNTNRSTTHYKTTTVNGERYDVSAGGRVTDAQGDDYGFVDLTPHYDGRERLSAIVKAKVTA